WTAANRPPRALILGVTPEIYHLPWPPGASVHAVDHTPAMIDAIWPGPRADVIEADWVDIPVGDASRDLVFCDGGLHLMPHGQHSVFAATMSRIVSPGGLCLFRLFVPPGHETGADHGESPEQVLDALMKGR